MTLYELFEQIPDPRSAQGRRHPLPALLILAVVAIHVGRCKEPEFGASLSTPSLSTQFARM